MYTSELRRVSIWACCVMLSLMGLVSGCKEKAKDNGSVAEILGIASYDVSLDYDSVIRILVNGKDGTNIGSVAMFADEDTGSLFSEYIGVTGQTATLYSEVFEDPVLNIATVRRTVFVGDVWLEIEVRGVDGDDATETVTFAAKMLSGMLPPRMGETRPDGDVIVATITTFVNGSQLVTDRDLQTWFKDVGLKSLLASDEAAYLMGVHADMALMDQIAALMAGDEPSSNGVDTGTAYGVVQQALTDSEGCGAASALKMATSGAKGFKSCGKCATKLAGAVAGTATTGGLGTAVFLMFAARDCYKCMKKGDQLSSKAAKCWYCCWGPDARTPDKTDAICRDSFACPGGREARATEDRFFCECQCDDYECNDYCNELVSQSGGAHRCDAKRGRCACDWDAEAFCKANHADRYCNGASKSSRGGFSCPQARCGDGQWDTGCINSALDEQCDPKSVNPGNCDTTYETCGKGCVCEMSAPEEPDPISCEELCLDSQYGILNIECMNDCCCEGADVCGWAGDGLCDCNGENYWDTCDCNPSENCEDTVFDTDKDEGGNETGSFDITVTYVNPRFDNRGLVASGVLDARPAGGATSGGGASGHLLDGPDDFNGLYLEYTISGASLNEPTDYTGNNNFFPEYAYTGTLTGPALRVSGAASFSKEASYGTDYGDFYARLNVTVTVGDVTETYELEQQPGEGPWNGISYDVSVPIP